MRNATWTPDVVSTVAGGMDRGSEPEMLGDQVAAFLRNVSTRGGRGHSRPRTKKVISLPAGKIQGAAVFESAGQVMFSQEGKVFAFVPDVWTVEEKSDETTRGNPLRARHWYCETQGSIVIQDFQNRPSIYDGVTFRAAEDDEVPVGGPMAYSNGRLAVTVGTGNQVRLGDIRQPEHQSELKFTETFFLTGGGDFSFASGVKALAPLPVVDTSTGQGSLIVGGGERVHSLKTQITSRDLWPDVEFQTEVFSNIGITGATAVDAVNQDLFFRSHDGLRSLRHAVSDLGSPGQTPLSREMSHRFGHDTDYLLEFATVVAFDNRLLVTHSPINYGNRGINLGLAVYNFDSISRAGQKSPPIYDGEWDFAQIAEIVVGRVSGRTRCFVFGRDVDGNNGVWEIYREVDDPTGITENPTQEIITRSLAGQGINVCKAIRACDIWLSKIDSDVNLKVYFKPDQYPFWVKWDDFSISAGSPGAQIRPHSLYRNPLTTRTVPEVFDDQTHWPLAVGFSFQIRLVWTGLAQVDMIQLWSERVTQPTTSDNVADVSGKLYGQVPADQEIEAFWFPYSSSPAP